MKRIITLLLTLVMVFSLAIPAQAASNTQATTMRLMETEGTATVENAIGKKLTIQDKMRLYNGYEVATQKASYAYISLDSNKAVKLDASSSVEVNQAGKKLELDVTAGELFFNVPVALKSDESLNIRSSTMVTGIRGTAGWVNALDRYTTRIGVLEGAVTIQSLDPFTGAERSVVITGGQIATIIRHERANAIQQQLIDDGVIIEENIIAELTKPGQVVEELQEDDVPGFVAAEVASDNNLQDRINEESPLDADEIAANAEERLSSDETAAAKEDKEIQKNLDNLFKEDSETIFTEPEIIYVNNTIRVPGETVTEYVTLNNPSTPAVQAVLDDIGIAAVTNARADQLNLTELVLDPEDELYILSGSLAIEAEETWNVSGFVSLLNYVDFNNRGTINVTSTDGNYSTLNIGYGTEMTNEGTINVYNDGGLAVSGVLNNEALINVGSVSGPGYFQIDSAGVLNNGATPRYESLSIDAQALGIDTPPEKGIIIYGDGSSTLANLGEFNNWPTGIIYTKAEGTGNTVIGALYNEGTLNMVGGNIVAYSASGTSFVFGVYNTGEAYISNGMILAQADVGPLVCALRHEGKTLEISGSQTNIGGSAPMGMAIGVYHEGDELSITDGHIAILANENSVPSSTLNHRNHPEASAALYLCLRRDSDLTIIDGELMSNIADCLMYYYMPTNNLNAYLTREYGRCQLYPVVGELNNNGNDGWYTLPSSNNSSFVFTYGNGEVYRMSLQEPGEA